MKIDPYKHKEKYLSWKEKVKDGIPNISKENSDIIIQYVNDMERGINISTGSVKGSRSYIRLNTLRDKLYFFSIKFKELFQLNKITDIQEEQLISFFSNMKNGVIKKQDGKDYQSTDSYARVFKSFWHWHQKINKKKGKEIPDITTDVDTRQEKPDWVYLTEEQIKLLCDNSRYDYKVLFLFLFDTGIRVTEMFNVRVSDFYNDFKELNIREETSKTFGRRIKLMICSELVKDFVKVSKLSGNDYLFNIKPPTANKYLKRIASKLFGNNETEAGAKYSELTMYDFRHNSCCYWLPRYKSESALKYRFGWKKSDKIHYYSELLGMKDTISEEDMLIDITKTEIEKRLEKSEKEKELIKEELDSLKGQLTQILEYVKITGSKIQILELAK